MATASMTDKKIDKKTATFGGLNFTKLLYER